jgi:ATP-binding cassette subfamily F protein 3
MAQYDGTIVVVSHNRYFLEGFVNKVLEVRDGNITLYEGNIAEYQAKQELLREEEKGQAAQASQSESDTTKNSPDSQESRKDKKRQEAQLRQERSRRAGPWLNQLTEAEKQVEFYEQQKEDIEALMADPELYSDERGWQKTSKEYEECKRRLDRWYEKWETAQVKIDQIDAELNLG